MEAAQRFMKALAPLVQPDKPEDAALALSAMVPMLKDIPDRAWASRGCLEAVIAADRRTIVPGLQIIRTAILQWLRDNPDRAPQLEDGTKAGWSEGDHHWLAYWRRRQAKGFEVDPPFHRTTRQHTLSLLHTHAPRVEAYVLNGLG